MFVARTLEAQQRFPEELAIAHSITMQHEGEIQVTPVVQHFKLPDARELTYAVDFDGPVAHDGDED